MRASQHTIARSDAITPLALEEAQKYWEAQIAAVSAITGNKDTTATKPNHETAGDEYWFSPIRPYTPFDGKESVSWEQAKQAVLAFHESMLLQILELQKDDEYECTVCFTEEDVKRFTFPCGCSAYFCAEHKSHACCVFCRDIFCVVCV